MKRETGQGCPKGLQVGMLVSYSEALLIDVELALVIGLSFSLHLTGECFNCADVLVIIFG